MRHVSRPSTDIFGEAWERLFSPAFAHRGLWSPGGAPENSLAAFLAKKAEFDALLAELKAKKVAFTE